MTVEYRFSAGPCAQRLGAAANPRRSHYWGRYARIVQVDAVRPILCDPADYLRNRAGCMRRSLLR